MKIKIVLKKIIYPLMLFIKNIKHHNGYLYIGLHTKFHNTSNIWLGNSVSIMPYTMLVSLTKKSKLVVGEGSEIGMFSRIGCLNNVNIGKYVLTGPNVFIADYNHEYRDITKPIMKQGNHEYLGGIYIGDGTWLGTNVVIVGKVTIGKNCVIGANSVVTSDIPDYCVAVGNPCKVIKKYNTERLEWERI